MLLTIFFRLLVQLIHTLISVLPTGTLPSAITASLVFMVSAMRSFDWFFPIGTLLSASAVILSFEGSVLTFKGLNWLLGKIRGSN